MLTLAAALVFAACGSDSDDSSSGNSGGGDGAVTLRLGYFPNVTHGPALIARDQGLFEEKLGSDVKIEYSTFNSGSEVTTAILAGALDASFVGPNPAINGYQKSGGKVKVVSGVANGGAFRNCGSTTLMVK